MLKEFRLRLQFNPNQRHLTNWTSPSLLVIWFIFSIEFIKHFFLLVIVLVQKHDNLISYNLNFFGCPFFSWSTWYIFFCYIKVNEMTETLFHLRNGKTRLIIVNIDVYETYLLHFHECKRMQ